MDFKQLSRRAAFALFFVALSSAISLGQTEPGPASSSEQKNYDVTLHLVIGSNDGSKADLPRELSGVLREMKSRFEFSNYRLASTFVGRVANGGSFEYKSVGSLFGKESETYPKSFLDWSLAGLRAAPGPNGERSLQAHSFRFGARIPVATGPAADAAYNYEAIGLSLNKAGLYEDMPTLIGTLNLPGAGSVIFLVMTVRSAAM